MLSFLFYLLSRGPVKKQKFCTKEFAYTLSFPLFLPTNHSVGYFSTSSCIFPLSCNKNTAKIWQLGHLGKLSCGFYWNLAFRDMWKSLSMFRVVIRKIILESPWLSLLTTDPKSWGSWGLGLHQNFLLPNENIFIIWQLFLLSRSQ